MEVTLAIETSCDDTSVAIVHWTGEVLSLVSATKDLDHEPYGGIVPEIASRNHSLYLLPLIEQALKKANLQWNQIHGISVTNRPGLMGSLIVGLMTAKSLSQSFQIPYLGVNHLEGHLLAPFLKDSEYQPKVPFEGEFLALAISGGHTSLYQIDGFKKYHILGATKDDAAGEAFDKFAKMAGLGFPGGVKVDLMSKMGDPKAFAFPRGMIHEPHYDMSFSGLKASAQRLLEGMSSEEVQMRMADLCASYQAAIVDVLIAKLNRAVQETGIKRVILTGGVSANTSLREKAEKWAHSKKVTLLIPPLRYCTDNAAMIGLVGILRMRSGEFSAINAGPSPMSLPGDFN